MTQLVYLSALRNNFVEWDDGDYASENLHIRSLYTSFSKWVFLLLQRATGTPLHGYSTPLIMPFGICPPGHHLTSIILHALNTFLVVALMILIGITRKPLLLI